MQTFQELVRALVLFSVFIFLWKPAWVIGIIRKKPCEWYCSSTSQQESPADAGIPARRKNDEKNSSISKL